MDEEQRPRSLKEIRDAAVEKAFRKPGEPRDNVDAELRESDWDGESSMFRLGDLLEEVGVAGTHSPGLQLAFDAGLVQFTDPRLQEAAERAKGERANADTVKGRGYNRLGEGTMGKSIENRADKAATGGPSLNATSAEMSDKKKAADFRKGTPGGQKPTE